MHQPNSSHWSQRLQGGLVAVPSGMLNLLPKKTILTTVARVSSRATPTEQYSLVQNLLTSFRKDRASLMWAGSPKSETPSGPQRSVFYKNCYNNCCRRDLMRSQLLAGVIFRFLSLRVARHIYNIHTLYTIYIIYVCIQLHRFLAGRPQCQKSASTTTNEMHQLKSA